MPSRYAAAHVSPQGPGDARPTAEQIIQDEGVENKFTDKVFLITGCSSGIGIDTARTLAKTGAKLYLTVRDTTKAEKILSNILKPGQVELIQMDLNSLDSVRAAVKTILSKSNKLNVLVENAGILAEPGPEKFTKDGFESQFGINHLAHFLLFDLLKDVLLASSTPSFHSRVVIVASSEHRSSEILFGNYDFKTPGGQEYNNFIGYAQSKLANLYMANEIENLYGAKALHGLSLHPGGIGSGLHRNLDPNMVAGWKADPDLSKIFKTSSQGAATTVWAAVAKELEGKGRLYLENCQVAVSVKAGAGPGDTGYASYAFDKGKEHRLWVDSLKMVGL
ncbi:hypothetical protein B7463_g3169, partial [Scytalidium lignicola]